jgi:hypothetical protein
MGRSLGERKPEDLNTTGRNPLVLILFTLLKISIKIYGAKTNKLSDGLYPRGLIVHQQRYQPGDSNTTKYILWCARRVPGITFIGYTQNQKITV